MSFSQVVQQRGAEPVAGGGGRGELQGRPEGLDAIGGAAAAGGGFQVKLETNRGLEDGLEQKKPCAHGARNTVPHVLFRFIYFFFNKLLGARQGGG